MLQQLLTLLQKGGSLTPVSLARQLKTSPAMVEMMLEDLARQKMIKTVQLDSACSTSNCKGCPISSSCKPQQSRMWTLDLKD